MTAFALKLENFDRELAVVSTRPDGSSAPDPDRTAAFDEGYSAGWEDSETAIRSEQDQAEAAMRARLQDLAFTFHEARAHVMRSLHPLLDAIIEKALPEILHKTLGHRLSAEIETMACDAADTDIALLVATGHAKAATELLGDITSLPFEVDEDPALVPGQIHMRLGHIEREIDLNVLRTTLGDALSALNTINEEVVSNG